MAALTLQALEISSRNPPCIWTLAWVSTQAISLFVEYPLYRIQYTSRHAMELFFGRKLPFSFTFDWIRFSINPHYMNFTLNYPVYNTYILYSMSWNHTQSRLYIVYVHVILYRWLKYMHIRRSTHQRDTEVNSVTYFIWNFSGTTSCIWWCAVC